MMLLIQPAGGYASLSKLENSRITSETSFKSLSRDHKELRKLFHKNPSTYGYDLKARENEERTGEKQVPVGEVVLCVTVFHPITVSLPSLSHYPCVCVHVQQG